MAYKVTLKMCVTVYELNTQNTPPKNGITLPGYGSKNTSQKFWTLLRPTLLKILTKKQPHNIVVKLRILVLILSLIQSGT